MSTDTESLPEDFSLPRKPGSIFDLVSKVAKQPKIEVVIETVDPDGETATEDEPSNPLDNMLQDY